MSWLYSRALGEAFSAGTCSDGEPSALSSGNPIPQAYSSPGKTTTASRLSRYGMTCEPLTESRGEELLTWFRAGFPVKTSALPERAPALTELSRACGTTWPASLAKFDLASFTWRTPQLSLLEDLDECLETWPRSGSMRNGECFPRPQLERTTDESESGSWPTPTASGFEVADISALLARRERMKLKHGNGNGFGLTLNQAVKMWPTPTCQDGTQVDPPSHRDGRRHQPCLGTLVNVEAGTSLGPLNPTWVEWLMGWPEGWTDLKPLAMDRFHEWQQQHS